MAEPLTLDAALEIVPDDLPDGAYWAMLAELTGMEPDEIMMAMAERAEDPEE